MPSDFFLAYNQLRNGFIGQHGTSKIDGNNQSLCGVVPKHESFSKPFISLSTTNASQRRAGDTEKRNTGEGSLAREQIGQSYNVSRKVNTNTNQTSCSLILVKKPADHSHMLE